jgi:hypothetical protein
MESMGSAILPLWSKEIPVETAAADVFVYTFRHAAIVKDFELVVTNAAVAADATPASIAVDFDPSDGARVEKVVFVVSDGQTVGAVQSAGIDVLNGLGEWTPFNVKPGDQLIVEVKTAAADAGTETGEFIVNAIVQFYPDKYS